MRLAALTAGLIAWVGAALVSLGLDRYVYAPLDGVFHTKTWIDAPVQQGREIAEIGSTVLFAPLDGVLRGLTHDNVPVTVGAKVIEVVSPGSSSGYARYR